MKCKHIKIIKGDEDDYSACLLQPVSRSEYRECDFYNCPECKKFPAYKVVVKENSENLKQANGQFRTIWYLEEFVINSDGKLHTGRVSPFSDSMCGAEEQQLSKLTFEELREGVLKQLGQKKK